MFDPDSFVIGGSVPAVAAADLAAVVKLMMDLAKRDEPQCRHHAAVGASFYQTICTPGADVGAVWFRAAMLCAALEHEPEFAELKQKGELSHSLLQLWSTFPFKPTDVQPDGAFHLNLVEFQQEFRKLNNSQ